MALPGPSLLRVRPCLHPFTHLSIDPLGQVRITARGSSTFNYYHIELMSGLQASEMYQALMKLQFRFNIPIVQFCGDHGTQLLPTLLGNKTDYYQVQLGKLCAVYTQFRNIAERKISLLLKEALFGLPVN